MLGYNFNIYADEVSEEARLDVLSEKYNLKDISLDDVPEGITPVVFNSLDELEEFLERKKDWYVSLDTLMLEEYYR